MPNQPVIIPMPKTYDQLEERVKQISENKNGISWYLSFKEPEKKCINTNESENKNNNKEEC